MTTITASASNVLTIEVTSFSYKKELPSILFSAENGRHGGGFVFDCRCLPNPGRLEKFKLQTGLDAEVVQYLEALPEVATFRTHAFGLVSAAVNNYVVRGFDFLSVGFGCTGGQHRSVFMAEGLSLYLKQAYGEGVNARVLHSNLDSAGRPKAL